MMKHNELNFFDELDIEEFEYVEQKRNKKLAKRKWREIEHFKEKQRLEQDLESINYYNF